MGSKLLFDEFFKMLNYPYFLENMFKINFFDIKSIR